VSVLIPSYNRDYILGSAIESVLAQTYRPIEVVLVDDGSTDGTRALVEKFGPPVRYIYQPNAGMATARNTGLAAARGEFVAFQDSDDLWMPWKLQVQVAIMRRLPELALVWTDMTAVDPHGKVLRERDLRTMYSAYRTPEVDDLFPLKGLVGDVCPGAPPEVAGAGFRYGDVYSALLLGNLVHPPTALMRREHVRRAGGLDVTYSWAGEDYEFFWRVARNGLGAVVEAPGMLYRVGAEDQYTYRQSRTVPASAYGFLLAIQRRLAEDRRGLKLSDRTIRRTLAEAHAWIAEEELLCDDGRGSAGHFWKSLRLNPFQTRALVLFPFSLIPRPLFRLARSLKQRVSGTRPRQHP
jgi:glycosyltransferase involved in cell wall biosynthesis